MVRIGVVTYNTEPRVSITLGQYNDPASLGRAIQNLEFQTGERNTSGALNAARSFLFSSSSGARPRMQKVIFLITNGQSKNTGLTQWEAGMTKSSGVEIFAIGVTNQVDEIELKTAASSPTSTHYYFASNYNSVTGLVDRIVEAYCTAPS